MSNLQLLSYEPSVRAADSVGESTMARWTVLFVGFTIIGLSLSNSTVLSIISVVILLVTVGIWTVYERGSAAIARALEPEDWSESLYPPSM